MESLARQYYKGAYAGVRITRPIDRGKLAGQALISTAPRGRRHRPSSAVSPRTAPGLRSRSRGWQTGTNRWTRQDEQRFRQQLPSFAHNRPVGRPGVLTVRRGDRSLQPRRRSGTRQQERSALGVEEHEEIALRDPLAAGGALEDAGHGRGISVAAGLTLVTGGYPPRPPPANDSPPAAPAAT